MEEIELHILEKFEIVEKLGNGNYGIVWKAINRKTKKAVAIKKIFDAFQNPTDAKRTFREVLYHQEFCDHENVIDLQYVIKSQSGKDLYMILEYMERDLHDVIRAKVLIPDHVKFIITQILRAVRYIHSGDVIHRDIKPANILVNQYCHAKLTDFGLARSVLRDLVTKNAPVMTEYAATRWYRAPEILFGSKLYTKAVDMWAVGCVLGEMFAGRTLFPGTSTLNQIEKILEFTGIPAPEDLDAIDCPLAPDILTALEVSKIRSINSYFPGLEDSALDLIKGLLQFNPKKRMTVEQAFKHKFIEEFRVLMDMNDERFGIERDSKGKSVVIAVEDTKNLTAKEYKDTLYVEIHKRKKTLRKLGKNYGSATSTNSDNFLASKSPSNTNLQDGDKTPYNWSGNSTPNNIQSKVHSSFTSKHHASNSPISTKSPQHKAKPSNFTTLATSKFGNLKQKTMPLTSPFKKQVNEGGFSAKMESSLGLLKK